MHLPRPKTQRAVVANTVMEKRGDENVLRNQGDAVNVVYWQPGQGHHSLGGKILNISTKKV